MIDSRLYTIIITLGFVFVLIASGFDNGIFWVALGIYALITLVGWARLLRKKY